MKELRLHLYKVTEEELRTLKELGVRWDFLSHQVTSLDSTDKTVIPKGIKVCVTPNKLELMYDLNPGHLIASLRSFLPDL